MRFITPGTPHRRRPNTTQPSTSTGFGSPFGATTTTASGFTGFGSTSFGMPVASSAPSFGSTFGTPAANTAPMFGSSFGTPGPSTAPTFGSTFGTPATSAPAFGSTFGTATTAAPGFGSTFGTVATSAPSLFGTPATKPSIFGTPSTSGNLFSTPATTSSLFGTSTVTTQAPGLFGATPGPSLFGSTTTTSAPSLFGAGSTFGTATSNVSGGGLFGTTPGPSFGGSTFGTGLFSGALTTSTPSFFGGYGTSVQPPTGGFGGFATIPTATFGGIAPTTTTGLYGGLNAVPSIPKIATPHITAQELKNQQVLTSIYAINIYGDERDNIIKKWNMLQACWGIGKGYYSNNQPPVEYDHTNPFYRFKSVSYSVIPTSQNADGLVKLHFNKKESDLSHQREVLVNGISGILGNKPNLIVNIEHIKAISETDSEVMISVSEKGITGTSRKIYATDLSNFLNQPMQKQQLTNVGVSYIGAYMTPTKEQLDEYLRVPPPGIDLPMWQAAQMDNPNPAKYIPTPMFGFTDLKKRMVCQEYETGLHTAFLQKSSEDILELKKKHTASVAQLTDRKQKLLELQHRVLRILVKQEAARKVGMAFSPDEETLRARLESLQSQLGVSTHFRGKLLELVSSVRLMDTLKVGPHTEQYRINPEAQEDVRQFIQMEQTGIQKVVETINQDLKDLKTIQDGLGQSLSEHNK
ncbi:Nup54 C-terminal interacting domain [Popillia japonica]|uniref:Nup54 C-terminal interacting domain n=1 Tax=Popillia japonica TaxID=7064 RepID=A0AAW1LS34_POPJA